LPHIARLPERIRHLQQAGVLDVKVDGGEARVTYGERTRAIATKWSVSLEKSESAKEVETATA
jgi:hypothetical protein